MQTEKQGERLVELLNAEISHLVLSDIDLVWTCERINYLANYLMSNNVVVLPFSVGSKVYFMAEWTDEEAIEGSLVSYSVDDRGIWFYCRYLCGLSMWHKIDDVGKTVFLSREEAEAKSREMRDGH